MIFWATLYTLFALLDVYCTAEAGPEQELNPVARGLMLEFGRLRGALLGVGVPSLAILTLCVLFKSPQCMAFFAGFRAFLALLQVRTWF